MERARTDATPEVDSSADDAVLDDLLEEKPIEGSGTEKPATDLPDAPEGHDSNLIDDLLGDGESQDRQS